MYKVTKEFNFEMGHKLDGHQGKCSNYHGHNYRLLVTLKCEETNSMDMVMDFYDLNNIVKPMLEDWDHASAINTKAKGQFEKDFYELLIKHHKKVLELPMRTTAENMAKYFYDKIQEGIDNLYKQSPTVVKGVRCYSGDTIWVDKVVVYETPTSCAEYSENE